MSPEQMMRRAMLQGQSNGGRQPQGKDPNLQRQKGDPIESNLPDRGYLNYNVRRSANGLESIRFRKNGDPMRVMGAREEVTYHVDTGQDPLKLLLSTVDKFPTERTLKEKTDIHSKYLHALYASPTYDPNFNPLAAVIAQRNLIKEDKVFLVDNLLEMGAPLNERDANGHTLLNIAIRNNEDELFIKLVQSGADINTKDDGNNLIYQLYKMNKSHLIPFIVESGYKYERNINLDNAADVAFKKFADPKNFNENNFSDSLSKLYTELVQIKKFKLHDPIDELDAHFDKLKMQFKKMIKDHDDKALMNLKFEEMREKLNEVKSLDNIPNREDIYRTNTEMGFNPPVMDGDPAAGNMFLFWTAGIDDYIHKSELRNALQETLEKVRELSTSDVLSNEEYFKDLKVNIKKYDLDSVIPGNINQDNLLLKYIREEQYELADKLMSLDVNLHAVDVKGNTAMHILANTDISQDKMFSNLSRLLGVPTSKDGAVTLKSIYDHNHVAKWFVRNNAGDTFMDVLYRKFEADMREKYISQELSKMTSGNPIENRKILESKWEHYDKTQYLKDNYPRSLVAKIQKEYGLDFIPNSDFSWNPNIPKLIEHNPTLVIAPNIKDSQDLKNKYITDYLYQYKLYTAENQQDKIDNLRKQINQLNGDSYSKIGILTGILASEKPDRELMRLTMDEIKDDLKIPDNRTEYFELIDRIIEQNPDNLNILQQIQAYTAMTKDAELLQMGKHISSKMEEEFTKKLATEQGNDDNMSSNNGLSK